MTLQEKNNRRQLIKIIDRYWRKKGAGPTKGEIARRFNISEKAAEHRIALLVKIGIVERSRQWRTLRLKNNAR